MVLLVMGVTGSGKTTVGRVLAQRLGWAFREADEFHSGANKAKMHQGIPLTDADRGPWLDAIHAELVKLAAAGGNVVLACSALKEDYRRRLLDGLSGRIVYLKGPPEMIRSRIRARPGHFAGESILQDQFASLEEPSDAIVASVTAPLMEVVAEILAANWRVTNSRGEEKPR